MAVQSENNPRLFSTSEIAQILGMSDRRIRQLAQAGAITPHSRGRYDLAATVQSYIAWIKEQATESNDEELDLRKEKTLLTRAQRKKVELELAIMKGELHQSADVEAVMNDMISAFRSRVLAIPSKVAPKLVGRTEMALIQEIIQSEAYEALGELAEYDAEVFYKRNKDYVFSGKSNEKEED